MQAQSESVIILCSHSPEADEDVHDYSLLPAFISVILNLFNLGLPLESENSCGPLIIT